MWDRSGCTDACNISTDIFSIRQKGCVCTALAARDFLNEIEVLSCTRIIASVPPCVAVCREQSDKRKTVQFCACFSLCVGVQVHSASIPIWDWWVSIYLRLNWMFYVLRGQGRFNRLTAAEPPLQEDGGNTSKIYLKLLGFHLETFGFILAKNQFHLDACQFRCAQPTLSILYDWREQRQASEISVIHPLKLNFRTLSGIKWQKKMISKLDVNHQARFPSVHWTNAGKILLEIGIYRRHNGIHWKLRVHIYHHWCKTFEIKSKHKHRQSKCVGDGGGGGVWQQMKCDSLELCPIACLPCVRQ